MRKIHKNLLSGVTALFVLGFRSGENGSLSKLEIKSPPANGILSGTITYPDEVPAAKILTITTDKEVCGKVGHEDESLVVGKNNGIKNVLVSILNVPAGKGKEISAMGADFTLDQTGCQFSPHVQLVPVGATLQILNNDGILHNIHTYSKINKSMNIAQPRFKKKMTRVFDAAEIVSVKCDVHGWMSGFIVVVDHPYHRLSDSEGRFELTDVPAGVYQVQFWHENLGVINREVTITTGDETKLDVIFPNPSTSGK